MVMGYDRKAMFATNKKIGCRLLCHDDVFFVI